MPSASSPLARDAPSIEVIVVQPTPFCNIDCSYCYLPSRSDKAVIAYDTVFNLFSKVFASGWACPRMTVIWHAGEPLVVPITFYREAFALIEALRPDSVSLKHSFQTNGTLITPEWCDFFIETGLEVGVSVDGPKHLHDRHRVTRSGRGTFDKTIAGLRLLRERNIPFHTISVLSRESLGMADEMYAFFVAEGIEQVCFNVDESEGNHISDLLGAPDFVERFRVFLDRFWKLARAGDSVKYVREIDNMISVIFRSNDMQFHNQQVEPLAMLNVDCHGNVSTFSPELLGYKNAEYNDFLLGNINTDTLAQLRDSESLAAMQRDIDAGVDICRKTCGYFSICGGGAPMNKLTENGSFRSGETGFCSLTQIVPAALVLSSVDRMVNREAVADALTSNNATT